MTLQPTTVHEAAEALRAASASRQSVAFRGSGSWQTARADVILDCGGLSSICDLSPRDLVVSVGAGVRLSQLNSALSSERTCVGWDPPGGDRTIGSVVATATSGPSTASVGPIRDQLLGLSFVTASGRIVTVGGRVMKNVAGFDLTRLLCGSYGALGLITEIHLRLRPEPESVVVLKTSFPTADVDSIGKLMGDLAINPTAWEGRIDDDSATISIRMAGHAEAIAEHAESLTPDTGLEWTAGDDWRSPHDALAGDTTIRIGTTVRTERRLTDAIRDGLAPGALTVSGAGIRWTGHADAGEIGALRRRAAGYTAPVTIERAPQQLLESVGIFGELSDGVTTVMGRIRNEFDPGGSIVHGRYSVAR